VLEALAILAEDRYLPHLFLTTIVRTDHELHLQLHEGVLRSGGDIHEGPFYPRVLCLPIFFMLSHMGN
jgi:hypothetical protein